MKKSAAKTTKHPSETSRRGPAKPVLCIVTKDQALRQGLEQTLAADGQDNFCLDPKDSELVVVDGRGEDRTILAPILEKYAPKSIVLVGGDDKDNINQLLASYDLSHLIGANGKDPVDEVRRIVQKKISGDIFGLGRYFEDQTAIKTHNIIGAEQIKSTIASALHALDLSKTFEALHEYLTLVTNELVTNAVYNAPVGEDGEPKYEKVDRREKIRLLAHETVRLSVTENEHAIGISVVDPFGRLTRDKIVQHLVKCVNNIAFIEEKKGGAGAGIYLAFHTASHFIVNLNPKRRLEIICIIEKCKRYKDYRARITSFDFFVTNNKLSLTGAA